MSPVDEEIDRLYELPLEEFTRARDELARRARQEGQAEVAARIKQLRKPTLPAWVVNQLARQRQLDVQRLLKAGEQLAGAQAEAIRAQSGDAFLDARRDEQHALEALAARAREILADGGRGAATLDRVLATLRAGSLTEDGRALLKSGRLTEELEPPGFDALAGLSLTGPATRTQREPTQSATRRKRKLADEARDLRRELRELKTRAAAAERQTAQLKTQLEAAEAEVNRLDRQRRHAEEALAAAERDLERLTRR